MTFCRLSSVQLCSSYPQWRFGLLYADLHFVATLFLGLKCFCCCCYWAKSEWYRKLHKIDKDMRFDEDCAVFGFFNPPRLRCVWHFSCRPFQFSSIRISMRTIQLRSIRLLRAAPPLIHCSLLMPLECILCSTWPGTWYGRYCSPQPQCFGSCMQVAFRRGFANFLAFATCRNLCQRMDQKRSVASLTVAMRIDNFRVAKSTICIIDKLTGHFVCSLRKHRFDAIDCTWEPRQANKRCR